MQFHSYLSPKCEVRSSKLGGFGVFAKKNILAGELVSVWGGRVLTSKQIDSYAKKFPHFATHAVSVYSDFYLASTQKNRIDDSERFNHSCNPNIGIRGQIVVVARRNIPRNDEICFDYDTTEISSVGSFDCKCGSFNCRKKIDGSGWKDPSFVKFNKEFLSLYILDKIKSKSGKHPRS